MQYTNTNPHKMEHATEDIKKMLSTWLKRPDKLSKFQTHTFRSKKRDVFIPEIISCKLLEVIPYSAVIVDAKIFIVTNYHVSGIYTLRFIAESAPYQAATHRTVLGIRIRNKFRFNPISLRKI